MAMRMRKALPRAHFRPQSQSVIFVTSDVTWAKGCSFCILMTLVFQNGRYNDGRLKKKTYMYVCTSFWP